MAKITSEMIESYIIDKLNAPKGQPVTLTSPESKIVADWVGECYLAENLFGDPKQIGKFLRKRMEHIKLRSDMVISFSADRLNDPANAENHAMILRQWSERRWLPYVLHHRKAKAAIRKYAKLGLPEAVRLAEIIKPK